MSELREIEISNTDGRFERNFDLAGKNDGQKVEEFFLCGLAASPF